MKRVTIEDVAPLIPEMNGNLAAISRRLGVSRGTIQNRVKASPDLQVALESAREGMIDNAESALYKAILNGNITAIIFFLKTRGKGRGYVERQELTGAEGGPVTYVSSDLDAELARLGKEFADRQKAGDGVGIKEAVGLPVDTTHADPEATGVSEESSD